MRPYITFGLLALIPLYIVHVAAKDCAVVENGRYKGACLLTYTLPRRPSPNTVYNELTPFDVNLNPYNGKGDKIKAQRHHIIPYLTLKNFYNTLVERLGVKPPKPSDKSDAQKLQKFFEASKKSSTDFYTKKWNADGKPNPTAIEEIKQFADGMAQETLTNNNGITDRSGGFANYYDFYTWIPGNLFIGPDHRTDDPGDKFDANAKKIVPQSEFTFLKNAYNEMMKYIANPGDKNINFSLLSSALENIFKKSEPYAFKRDNWNIDAKNKKYSIKTN